MLQIPIHADVMKYIVSDYFSYYDIQFLKRFLCDVYIDPKRIKRIHSEGYHFNIYGINVDYADHHYLKRSEHFVNPDDYKEMMTNNKTFINNVIWVSRIQIYVDEIKINVQKLYNNKLLVDLRFDLNGDLHGVQRFWRYDPLFGALKTGTFNYKNGCKHGLQISHGDSTPSQRYENGKLIN
jgi:hypothetical protein